MRLAKFLMCLAFAAFLAACGGGGDAGTPTNGCGNQCPASSTALFTTAPDTLNLVPGASAAFTIGGGGRRPISVQLTIVRSVRVG